MRTGKLWLIAWLQFVRQGAAHATDRVSLQVALDHTQPAATPQYQGAISFVRQPPSGRNGPETPYPTTTTSTAQSGSMPKFAQAHRSNVGPCAGTRNKP